MRRYTSLLHLAAALFAAGIGFAPARADRIGTSVAVAPGVHLYASNATAGTAFTVTVSALGDSETHAVPVERVKPDDAALNFARFGFVGTVVVTVTVPDVATYVVSPLRYGLAPTVDAAARTIRFELSNDTESPYFRPPDGSIKLAVHNRDDTGAKLFLFADRWVGEPARDGTQVFDAVQDFGVSTGASDNTQAIDAAIDSLSSLHLPGTATLVLPPGQYRTGTIEMKDDVTLYLTGGATVIRPPGVTLTDAMIRFEGVHNAHLAGPGVVNANLWHATGDNIVRMNGATDCSLRDVTLTGTGTWSIHLLDCAGILARNYKLVNEPTDNSDGIDPDHSRRVTIEDVFEFTKDDAFAIKTSEASASGTDSVSISHSVVWTEKSALKIGSEIRRPIRHVTFEDNQVIQADRGLAIYGNGSGTSGGYVEGVTFVGNAIERIVDLTQGKLVEFQVQYFSAAPPYAPIRDVSVRRTFCYAPAPNVSTIAGKSGTSISDVTFEDFWIDAAHEMVTDAAGNVGRYFSIGSDATGIRFQRAAVTATPQVVAAREASLTLSPPAPNPSVDGVAIDFSLARPSRVELSVLDVAGRVVAVLADGSYSPGRHHVVWDGAGSAAVPPGLYFVRARSGGDERVRRWIRLR